MGEARASVVATRRQSRTPEPEGKWELIEVQQKFNDYGGRPAWWLNYHAPKPRANARADARCHSPTPRADARAAARAPRADARADARAERRSPKQRADYCSNPGSRLTPRADASADARCHSPTPRADASADARIGLGLVLRSDGRPRPTRTRLTCVRNKRTTRSICSWRTLGACLQ